ncbi:unnamed protein product [Leptidea sinapis]|uniref:Uncharacterized protein n=1 Tax=Leptidea sinapis TaxID=189913 RepID=A0A5E4QY42_9NEOP|nr:unnamed protein product [Leptidea sinapis]
MEKITSIDRDAAKFKSTLSVDVSKDHFSSELIIKNECEIEYLESDEELFDYNDVININNDVTNVCVVEGDSEVTNYEIVVEPQRDNMIIDKVVTENDKVMNTDGLYFIVEDTEEIPSHDNDNNLKRKREESKQTDAVFKKCRNVIVKEDTIVEGFVITKLSSEEQIVEFENRQEMDSYKNAELSTRSKYRTHMGAEHPTEYICVQCGYCSMSEGRMECHKKQAHAVDVCEVNENTET